MQGDCAFCDRRNFEENLIAETSDFWVIATLGQIVVGYTLTIPKRHIPCIGAMEEPEIRKVEETVIKISDATELEFGIRPVVEEHGIVGQTIPHAHLHFVPAHILLTDRVVADFPEAEINLLTSLEVLRRIYAEDGKRYLLWSTFGVPRLYFPAGLFQVAWNPPAPPQYLRLITAELLGRPERGNWRNMDPELDKRLRQETVARLKPYFT